MTPRLGLLLLIVAGLVVLRISMPLSTPSPQLAEAVPRNVQARAPIDPGESARAAPRAGEPAIDNADVPGNAFAVPVVAAPPTPPAPLAPARPEPVVVQVAPVVTAAPASEEPPPLQVIGTYDDGGAPAIFVATPSGIQIVREGSVVLAEYRITGITKQNVSLLQLSNQRSLQLAIPGGAGS